MLEFRVLGVVGARRDGVEVSLSRPLERRLLGLLLVHPRRSTSDEEIIEALWPTDRPAKPSAALQTAISRLRRALGGRETVIRESGGYRLAIEDPEAVDAERFEDLVAQGLDRDDPGLVETALDLWIGRDAFADLRYDDFARSASERLTELRLEAVEIVLRHRLDAGSPDAVVPEVLGELADAPHRESLYGLLMLSLYRSGRQADAIKAFQTAAERLSEFGLEPSQSLARLEEQILLQAPELDPLDASVVRTNVPSPASEVVGRVAEIETMVKRLGDSRLVSAVGPGGVGKTTVAFEAARRLVAEQRAETWWVDLTSVTDDQSLRSFIGAAVADALGVPAGPMETDDDLIRLLDRPMTLLVDNCEHVLDESARLVRVLLTRCPRLRVLATSRERLGFPGEVIVAIEPLRVDETLDGELGPAVRLFLQRARQVRSDFPDDEDTVVHVARICDRLDGLPLAIELAAGRCGTLSLDDLEQQIGERIESLEAQPASIGRHRSLVAAFDWSYELLDADRQQLLQLLATVIGPFSIRDAVALVGDGTEATVSLMLSDLRDKSLVVAESAGRSTTRFSLLMTVRELAASKADEAGRSADHALRHALAFRALSLRAEPHLIRGTQQLRWIGRVTSALPDLQSAIRTFIDRGMLSEAIETAAGLGYFWDVTRYTSEGVEIAEEILAAAQELMHHKTGRLLVVAGNAALFDGTDEMHDAALPLLNGAVEAAAEVGDQITVVDARAALAAWHWYDGDAEMALSLGRAVQVEAAGIDHLASEATGRLIEGLAIRELDDAVSAWEILSDAVEQARRAEDIGIRTYSLLLVGAVARDLGRFEESEALYEECYADCRRFQLPLYEGVAAAGVGLALALADHPDDARRWAALASDHSAGRPTEESGLAHTLIFAEPSPRDAAVESSRLVRGSGSESMLSWLLETCADLAERRGQVEPAAAAGRALDELAATSVG